MNDLDRICRAVCCPHGCKKDDGEYAICQIDAHEYDVRAALDALTLQDLAILAAKHGHAVVPDAPTIEMFSRDDDEYAVNYDEWRASYRAMIAAGRVKPG